MTPRRASQLLCSLLSLAAFVCACNGPSTPLGAGSQNVMSSARVGHLRPAITGDLTTAACRRRRWHVIGAL